MSKPDLLKFPRSPRWEAKLIAILLKKHLKLEILADLEKMICSGLICSVFSLILVLAAACSAKKPMLRSPLNHQTFTNSLGMRFVYIPPGQFLMGSNNGGQSEKPVHRITLTKGFFLQTTEVTQGQWRHLMNTQPWHGRQNVDIDDDYPATFVSWYDAQDFLKELSQKERRTYRLPTEAEWEYACRAGSSDEYFWGKEIDNRFLWYLDNADGRLHKVASKKSNPWGLIDMLGNVWEWCQDYYDSRYYQGSPSINPSGPATGEHRVMRGGSRFDGATGCRCASRYIGDPDFRHGCDGFRALLDASPSRLPTMPNVKKCMK